VEWELGLIATDLTALRAPGRNCFACLDDRPRIPHSRPSVLPANERRRESEDKSFTADVYQLELAGFVRVETWRDFNNCNATPDALPYVAKRISVIEAGFDFAGVILVSRYTNAVRATSRPNPRESAKVLPLHSS